MNVLEFVSFSSTKQWLGVSAPRSADDVCTNPFVYLRKQTHEINVLRTPLHATSLWDNRCRVASSLAWSVHHLCGNIQRHPHTLAKGDLETSHNHWPGARRIAFAVLQADIEAGFTWSHLLKYKYINTLGSRSQRVGREVVLKNPQIVFHLSTCWKLSIYLFSLICVQIV